MGGWESESTVAEGTVSFASLPPLPVTVQGRDWAAGTLGAPTTAEVGARAGAHAATFGNPGPMTSALNITKTVSIVFDDD